jgi:hypothetical protein
MAVLESGRGAAGVLPLSYGKRVRITRISTARRGRPDDDDDVAWIVDERVRDGEWEGGGRRECGA